MSALKESKTPVVDLSDVEDQSAFVQGFDVDTFVSEGASVVTSARDLATKATHATQAVTLMVLTVLFHTRDESGFPVWSFGANTMPDTVATTIKALATAAGLSDEESKTVLGTNVRQALNRARESFMAAYVVDNLQEDLSKAIKTETDLSTQEAGNYTGALAMLPPSIVAMIPEVLQDAPLKPSKVSAAFKKGMAEQYAHSGLTLPEKYGGTPKDGNDKGTKDKIAASVETELVDTATQAIAGRVGTEGGSSFLSVSIGSLAVTSALVMEVIDAAKGEITDRAEVSATLLRLSQVARIGAAAIADPPKYDPDKDGKLLDSAKYDPEKDGAKK